MLSETNPNHLVSQQDHLTAEHKVMPLRTLQKHEQLFEGLDHKQLGDMFPDCEHHIDLNLGAKACHIKQSHSILLDQVNATKVETQRQVNLGIVERCCATERGMHMFIIPRTDGTCRLIADFQELKEVAKPVHCPPPRLQDVFQQHWNFLHVATLDVSMQSHNFLLGRQSQELCVMVTPFGKSKHLQLPLGFLDSPLWAQAAMEELFSDMTDFEACINRIGMFSNDSELHTTTVHDVLQQLEQPNFAIEAAAECHWCRSKAPWLGCMITSTGMFPNTNEIKPIPQLDFPKTVTEL